MSMYPCPRCASPIIAGHDSCPHCHAQVDEGEEIRALPAALLGLLLAACGDKDTDTAAEDTAVGQDLYGVPALDLDDEDEE